MLDEVDKLGNDFRGDPASALLEILDPAQNNTFRDNYIDLPFDLSKVFFIATANQLQPIPMPLRDRMEIIQLAGYSDREKLNIAKQYLIPRQIKENGLTEDQLTISDDAINLITSRYTREAGVRQLERTVGNLARKVALKGRARLDRKGLDHRRGDQGLPRAAACLSGRSEKRAARRVSQPEWRGPKWAARFCLSRRHCCPAAAA